MGLNSADNPLEAVRAKLPRGVPVRGEDARPAQVFISYAHDDGVHEERVRDFWLFLRGQGVDAQLDLLAAEQRMDWAQWMTLQVREAQWVLVIASPQYRRRAEGDAPPGEGRGVQWEARLIREVFYTNQKTGLRRVLPVVLPDCSADDIPFWLAPVSATHYLVSDYSVAGAETLLRVLTGQPRETEPPLGVAPVLPPRAGGDRGLSLAFPSQNRAGHCRNVLALTIRFRTSKITWNGGSGADAWTRSWMGPGGYLVVEGPAGVGKTTFLAHLVKSRRYPWGFIASELDDSRTAIIALCDRLAERWKLPRRLAAGVRREWESPGAHVDRRLGAAVEALLREAAERGREQVVLVIDGVTADDPHLNLIMPRVLPRGVYVIIGQRPGGRATEGFESVAPVSIQPSEQTTPELRQWVAEAARHGPLSEVLQRAGIAPEEFTDTLARKAAGVWVYARYVLADVLREREALDPSEISTIPSDLWRYFARYFTDWRKDHPDTWASRDLPALATLAAAREDLSVKMLASVLVGAEEIEPEAEKLHGLLGRSWISFLSHLPGSDVYGCYHQSLRDFVAGNLPVTGLTKVEQALQAELQRALVRANCRLGERYLELVDGEVTPNRPRLRTRAAEHFAAAGELDGLRKLLARGLQPIDRFGEQRQPRNDAYRDCEHDGDVGGYLTIARAALDVAHQPNSAGSISSAETVRYALIGSSVISMAAGLPTGLLRAVLARGLWTSREVLHHIEAIPEQHQRAQQLAQFLPDLTGAAFVDGAELLAETGASESIERFLGLMARRLVELPDDLLTRLLAALRTEALQRLCPALCHWMLSEQLPLLLRRILAATHWDTSLAENVRACAVAASPNMREVLVRQISDSTLPENQKAMAIAPFVTLLKPELRRVELTTWAAGRLSHYHIRYIGGIGRGFFDPPAPDAALAYGYLAPVLPGLLSRDENASPPRISLPRRLFQRRGRRTDDAPGPPVRDSILDDPELLARAHCAAASAALTDEQRAEHAGHAAAAITALDYSRTRSQLLLMLCAVPGDRLDAHACLNDVFHGHTDFRCALLECLLPRLGDDDLSTVFDWATRGQQPYLKIIEVLLPRLKQAQIERLLARTWPEDTEHNTLERQRLLLSAADESIIQRYLDANLPPPGSTVDWAATERLAAVCVAPQASRKQVLACVRRVIDDDPENPYHHEVLVAGLPRLPPAQIGQLAEEAGVLAGSLTHGRAKILDAIAGALPTEQLPAVIAVARTAGDSERQEIIGSIAERLPPELLDEAVDIARRIGDDHEWSRALSLIVPQATARVRRQVAAATWPFRLDTPRGFPWNVFHAASSGLPAKDTLEMLDALQRELAGKADERARSETSRVLRAAFESRSTEVAARCAQLATEQGLLDDPQVVEAILERADQDTRQQIVERVWEAAHLSDGEQAPDRLEALTTILGYLPEERVLAAVNLLVETARGGGKASLLLALAERWPQNQLDAISRLVTHARAAADSDDPRCTALRAIASRSSGDLRRELFDEILDRLDRRVGGYGDQTLFEGVVHGTSSAAASRLRAVLLERLKNGERAPDYLLTLLAAKLPVAEALAAVRDALQSSAAPVRDDARRLVAGLAGRVDGHAAQTLLELIAGVEDHRSRGELLTALARVLSPEQAHYALSTLQEIPPSTSLREVLLGRNSAAWAVVTARHALASQLDPTERSAAVDDILRVAAAGEPYPDLVGGYNSLTPDWAAELVPGLVPDASPHGHELATAIARQLPIEDAAAVHLAVAARSATSGARAAAFRRAVDLITGATFTQRGRIRPGATKVSLLSAAARACDGAEANHLFSEALTATEDCTIFDNEQCTVLLDRSWWLIPGHAARLSSRRARWLVRCRSSGVPVQ